MSGDYHHGDLPTALRAAAVELIAERGPGGFSLREVARRAGVSHAAPAHHFGDARGLLTSVAAEGFGVLAHNMAEAANGIDDARELLIRCGRTYLRTALENPGHYGVMIGHDYTDPSDLTLLEASVHAHEQLLTTVRALQDAYNADIDIDATATLCWATMHGLSEMAPHLDHVAACTNTTTTELDTLVEKFADMIIEGIRAE